MQEIDYLEDQARRNAAFSLDNLDKINQRAQGLLTLLLGGAGGAGVYALGQLGKAEAVQVVWALASLSLWWFGLAALLAVRAVPTREVRAPANDGLTLLRQLQGPFTEYVKVATAAGESPRDAFTLVREAELKVLHDTAAIYRNASSGIAAVLDKAYLCMAASPVAPALALWAGQAIGAF